MPVFYYLFVMRRILLFTILLPLILPLNCKADTIILKNGSKIKGRITAKIDDTVVIKSAGNNIIRKSSEIKSVIKNDMVTFKEKRKSRSKKNPPPDKNFETKNYEIPENINRDIILRYFGSIKLFKKKFREQLDAVKNNPDDPDAHYKLALSFYYIQKYDKAIREFTFVNTNDKTLMTEIGRFVGYSYYYLGNYERAKEYIESYYKKKPSDNKALALLAEINYSMENYAKAAKYYKKLLAISPKNKEYADKLNESEKRLGIKKEGKKNFIEKIKEKINSNENFNYIKDYLSRK